MRDPWDPWERLAQPGQANAASGWRTVVGVAGGIHSRMPASAASMETGSRLPILIFSSVPSALMKK